MEALILKQSETENEINRCIRNFKKANKEQKSSPGSLKRRLISLETEWETYKTTHQAILREYNKEIHKDIAYFKDDIFSAVEDKVFETMGTISDMIESIYGNSKLVVQSETTAIRPVSDVHLPRINLPRFSGDYNTWSSFRDLFTSLIHNNNSLTFVQKLHYLKTSLSGEAEQLVKHLQVTEANYHPAWSLLTKRYENKRALLNAQLKTLFSLSHHTSESANSLRTLLDTTRGCLESIKGLGVDIVNWDSLIIHQLTQKLSIETLSQWELVMSKRSDPTELPTLDDFLSFIEIRFRTLESINLSKVRHSVKEKASFAIQGRNISSSKMNPISSPKVGTCQLCKQSHLLRDCSKFLELNLNDRRAFVQRFSYCYNCLVPGHSVVKCRSKYHCRACGGRHHTLLHQYPNSQEATSNNSNENKPSNTSIQERLVNTARSYQNTGKVLLATALVLARNSEGYCISLRALVDQGSETSFISQKAAKLLHLEENNTNINVKGVGSQVITANKSVEFTICSRYKRTFQFKVEALVLPKLTSLLPPERVHHQSWIHLDDLFLADPTYFIPGNIDILLGADVYAHILEEGIRKGPDGAPLAQHTSLGWILSGGVNPHKRYTLERNSVTSFHCKIDLDSLLRRFWEVEEGPVCNKLSEEEAQCERIYQNTVRRQNDGRYIVKLPFNTKDMIPDLGESRQLAINQLLQIEKRLERTPELHKQYVDFMRDYELQGHMEMASTEIHNATNYLPHHFITKASSTTTRLRVVFDASRRTTNKKSLNDNLMVGPTVQDDLFNILTRWRMHKVAFTADVKQMYRQILVDRNDTEFQRIVWRYQKDEPISEYRLLTVTYGTSCAPYLATRTLHQLAQDEAEGFPVASRILLNDFYVDDVLSGGDTIEEVSRLQADLRCLLKKGCFELRKWVSNREEILEGIADEERELDLPFDITSSITIKALGIYWDPVRDIFTYKVNNIDYKPPTTKRNLLSGVAKIFDPLGWLSPVIITAKVLFQALWLQRLQWDSELPPKLELQWKEYCSRLKDVEEIQIPRWINTTRACKSFELHVFSDASMYAYGACIYARVVTHENTIHTMLLTAKTKVAPIKPLTLPRLELCGALLGTKLVKSVATNLTVEHSNIYSWTDSKIVLGWVRSHPRQWKQFVANRVAEIQNSLCGNKWNYVSSKENPADCSSRGLTPSQLKDHELWWFGPLWLRNERNKWPQIQEEIDLTNIEEEQAKSTKFCNITTSTSIEFSFIERFSSYSRLIRICAYCRRFYNNLRLDGTKRNSGYLKVKELQDAEKCILKFVQGVSFREEIRDLKNKKQLKNSSKILSLHPILDAEGLLRIGGRLQNSYLPFNERCPLILPGNNHFTKLLVEEVHKITLHGGIQLMLNVLRKTYWIVNARNLAKRTVHNCITCFRYTAKTRTQLMGNLPAPRVRPSRPFSHTGVDFAGPFEIKAYTGRGKIRVTKGYVALFICLSTRAIHLEAVCDLSTDAFLAAFKRFTGRRGICHELYSDCGTNFKGANRKLSEEYHSTLKSISPEIASALALQQVNWNFIPPASPHFGGLWEAGVKSTKHHLKRVVKDRKLTFEELSTVLAQVEACLNSRPICPLTDDPDDCSALTPGHFLIGGALLTPPEMESLDTKINYNSRWLLLQQTYQNFWKRWSREYLTRLQQRPKWLKQEPNVRVGDLVLVKEDNLPPSRWLLGRILETHPGTDGLVRVVTLKCKESRFKRPISKICPLPINNTEYSCEMKGH